MCVPSSRIWTSFDCAFICDPPKRQAHPSASERVEILFGLGRFPCFERGHLNRDTWFTTLTDSSAGLVWVTVLRNLRMAAQAIPLLVAPACVLFVSDRLHVVRVHASLVLAEVIYREPIRDRVLEPVEHEALRAIIIPFLAAPVDANARRER